MMGLTVLNVAYPFAAVGPDAVGGAEQILSLLDRALVRAGHRSVVVAREGSRVAGTLVPTTLPDGAILTDEIRRAVHRQHLRNIERAIDRHGADVIHMHGIDFFEYLPAAEATGADVPALITLHLPPAWYPPRVFRLDRRRTFLHCVSAAQRRACPPSTTPLLPNIENGVDVDALRFRCSKRRYAMSLGRICPEKNQHAALDAARVAGMPAFIGGDVFPHEAHLRYFAEQIAPRLDGRHRRFLGPLNAQRKRRLLAGARCLLHPTLAPETSSLVAMEALACGTPVVAFPSGALPEIIEHGVTGWIVRNIREMADAIEAADTLDSDVCRETARRKFSLEAMLDKYFDAYRRIVASGDASAQHANRNTWPVHDGDTPTQFDPAALHG